MPQYKKAFDIGTYTGNGGQYRVGIPTLRSVGPTGTQIAQSLRFRSSNNNYLNRTPASSTNRTTWTWSAWVKIGSIQDQHLYAAGADGNNRDIIEFNVGGSLNGTFNFQSLSGGSTTFQLTSTVFIRDSSQWYHFMVVADTSNATSTQRVLSYINGVRVTSFGTATYPSQNYATNTNTNNIHTIGRRNYTGTSYFDGYMAEVNFIDGQALTPSSFGEYNSDGIWVPKAYSSTYGTNGYYLKFAPGAAGTDSSGNSNTWTLNGFNVSTANTSYDIMTDSPTDYLSGSMSAANNAGNYASLSPYNKSSALTVSNGNLYFTGGSFGGGDTFSQIAVNMNLPTSGKWYFEFQPQSTGSDANTFGFNITRRNRDGNGWPASRSNPGYPGYYSFEYGLYLGGGSASDTLAFRNNYVTNATTTQIATGVVTNVYTAWYGVAIDCDSSTFQMYRNGVALGSATSFVHPGTDAFIALMKGDFAMAANFGQQPFGYGVPSGYKALNTYNIPRPADSSLWFYGDTPDMIWIKNRSASSNNVITDTVRGIGINKVTNARSPDLSYPSVSEMNKFGMSVINDSVSVVNGSGNSHVYWGWKANGSSTVTNTDGTNTSQVSANRQAGFSIVSWVYNSSGSTIGHGLGAAPSFIIQYSRTTGYNTDVYHVSLGATKRLTFNTTSASETFTGPWNNTEPTSSVFSSGASWWTNGDNMLSYCWTAIPGYSAFGSYTGNGSTDGPFIYLGFRPRWLLVKCSSSSLTSGAHWVLMDTTRYTYNPNDNILYPNLSNSEGTGEYVDILSNGFKIRTTTARWNSSGETFIYAAFAETPFKFARAR